MKYKENDITYFRAKLLGWGRENFYDFSWRSIDNLWHALVAEVMLQRTRSDVVEPEFIKFVEKYPTPEVYINDKGRDTFKNLGLPSRENILIEIANRLVKEEPLFEKNDLLAIPGIGNYTAAAVRSMFFKVRDTIIDGNVIRVYSRFFGFIRSEKLYRDKDFLALAENVTPVKKFRFYNYALLDFGREICAPIPKCPICPVKRKCEYYKNNKKSF
ncbi:hypothetical protein CEF21_03940 [Bacillus sp. FJAT-42376]|uniref:hypothetical protein n=1 Tax=Bacillus sp. FJAT-42376 TaxID=2014076 RepID=UPI000F4D5058|nr:hypothetical protein [Bacillus sp. FJAT-42376]AZB41514.1 hypothetical protein CEF21_03940 [Bacillus sp. FJAT-42376]